VSHMASGAGKGIENFFQGFKSVFPKELFVEGAKDTYKLAGGAGRGSGGMAYKIAFDNMAASAPKPGAAVGQSGGASRLGSYFGKMFGTKGIHTWGDLGKYIKLQGKMG